VGNNVTYGPWVQSGVNLGGVGPQAMVHKLTGWRTVEQVARQEERNVVARIEQELTRQLGG
jgi:hypothetical protein